jgi:hypothetical protein
MPMTGGRARDDRGLAIVFTALLLVVLMIFAALALDLGNLYSARRNDQNAADASALGGAIILDGTDAALVAQVKDSVNKTLGTTLSDAQWNSCGAVTDPDPVDTPMTGSNCITVNGARSQVQVRVPTRTLNAIFGRAAGVNGFDHAAFAIAGLASAGFGSVLPFGMPAGGPGDGYSCIKSGSGGTTVDPCDGTTSGNFGYVDFSQFGNTDTAYNTPLDCGNGAQRERSANNMAVGVDHDLSKFNSAPYGSTAVVDTAACAQTPQTQRPNSMDTTTGNTVSLSLSPGIAFGPNSGTFTDGSSLGRLARSSPLLFSGAGTMKNVAGTLLDNNPLWEFIPTSFPSGASVPTSCAKSVFTDVYGGNLNNLPGNVKTFIQAQPGRPDQMRLLLQRCFTHYTGVAWTADGNIGGGGDPSSCPNTGCTDPVFSRNSSTSDTPDLPDIQYTPRFGYVPQLTTAYPNGNQTVNIASFRALFFQRLLGACNGNTCNTDFEPGFPANQPDMTNVPKQAEAITAFVFPPSMLPNGLAGDSAPFEVGKNRFVRLIR